PSCLHCDATARAHPHPLSLHDALPISIPWMPTRAEARQYADTRSLPVTRPIGLVGTKEERVAPRPGAPSPVRDERVRAAGGVSPDRKSTRLNSSHVAISYAVFCLKKKK